MTTPLLTLVGERLESLELVVTGLLAPVDGYRVPGSSPEGWRVVPRLRVDAELGDRAVRAGELELRDADTTPLARLSVESSAPADDGGIWLAGTLTVLRPPEHGVARAQRLSTASDLTDAVVALFGGEVWPADVLRIVQEADGRPLALIAEGSADPAESARITAALADCARLVPGARTYFVPATDLAQDVDVTAVVLGGRGATDVRDLRRATTTDTGGAVVLFTGLSGAGKSTIARAVTEHLRINTGRRVVLLDGDHLRTELAGELGFSAEDRDRNLQRQAWVAARVAEAGGLAVCAPIAPFAASRAAMRAKVEPDSPFLIVYVSTPLAIAEQRDRKGLYAKARSGLIKDFTGIDSPYEVPTDADLEIDTSRVPVEDAVGLVERMLSEKGLISGL